MKASEDSFFFFFYFFTTIEVISSDRTTDSKANGNFLKKIPSSPVLIVNSTPETDLNLNTDSRT